MASVAAAPNVKDMVPLLLTLKVQVKPWLWPAARVARLAGVGPEIR